MSLFKMRKEITISKGTIDFIKKTLEKRKPKFKSNLCNSCVFEFNSKTCPLYYDPKRNKKNKDCTMFENKYKDV